MPIESRLSFKDLDEFDTPEDLSISIVVSNLHIFTLQDLKLATNNFSKRKLIGEGGFGAVYKGHVDEKLCSTLEPQDVAIKLLDLTGCQGHKEWLVRTTYLISHLNPLILLIVQIIRCYISSYLTSIYRIYADRSGISGATQARSACEVDWILLREPTQDVSL